MPPPSIFSRLGKARTTQNETAQKTDLKGLRMGWSGLKSHPWFLWGKPIPTNGRLIMWGQLGRGSPTVQDEGKPGQDLGKGDI